MALIYLGSLLRSAQICKKCTILGNLRTITHERKEEIRQMTPFFSSTFWALTFCEIAKIHFYRILLSSILVCKILEFCRCKLWDQNFVSFDSGNIRIKECKKPGFIFSFVLKTKFVWSYDLLLLVPECYSA